MNNNNFNIITASDIATSFFKNLDSKTVNDNINLLTKWKKIISKVELGKRKYGEQLSVHSSPVQLVNGMLLIEADHPGWIQILQLTSKYILNGLKREVPELKITSLSFRLKGTDVHLYDKTYDEQVADERNKILAKEKDYYRKDDIESKSENKLPLELQKKFDSLKKSINESKK